jgi:hypothetical protein
LVVLGDTCSRPPHRDRRDNWRRQQEERFGFDLYDRDRCTRGNDIDQHHAQDDYDVEEYDDDFNHHHHDTATGDDNDDRASTTSPDRCRCRRVLSYHLWWQLLLGGRVLPGCRPWDVGYGGQWRADHLPRQQRVAVGARLTAVPSSGIPARLRDGADRVLLLDSDSIRRSSSAESRWTHLNALGLN